MGLVLDARCSACGLARDGVRVGATSAQMSGERRSAFHLFPCPSCRTLAVLELFLGEETGSPPCDVCRAPVPAPRAAELRVTLLKGLKLDGHKCPKCDATTLSFVQRGAFL